MRYIDANFLRKEIKRLKDEYTDIAIDSQKGWVNANFVIDDLEQLQTQIDSLQQEQLDVNLENVVEFECIGKKVKMTIQELINYYIDTECAEVADECGF